MSYPELDDFNFDEVLEEWFGPYSNHDPQLSFETDPTAPVDLGADADAPIGQDGEQLFQNDLSQGPCSPEDLPIDPSLTDENKFHPPAAPAEPVEDEHLTQLVIDALTVVGYFSADGGQPITAPEADVPASVSPPLSPPSLQTSPLCRSSGPPPGAHLSMERSPSLPLAPVGSPMGVLGSAAATTPHRRTGHGGRKSHSGRTDRSGHTGRTGQAGAVHKLASVVNNTDPWACPICFHCFERERSRDVHLIDKHPELGLTKHSFSESIYKDPQRLSYYRNLGFDTTYTGKDAKQRAARRRMDAGINQNSPGYLADVYGISAARSVGRHGGAQGSNQGGYQEEEPDLGGYRYV